MNRDALARSIRLAALAAAMPATAALAATADAGPPDPVVELDWISVDSAGGTMTSAGPGPDVLLQFTVGQVDAFTMSNLDGPIVELFGGFHALPGFGFSGWTGGGGTSFLDGQNWTDGVVPGDFDVVTLIGVDEILNLSASDQFGSLRILNGSAAPANLGLQLVGPNDPILLSLVGGGMGLGLEDFPDLPSLLLAGGGPGVTAPSLVLSTTGVSNPSGISGRTVLLDGGIWTDDDALAELRLITPESRLWASEAIWLGRTPGFGGRLEVRNDARVESQGQTVIGVGRSTRGLVRLTQGGTWSATEQRRFIVGKGETSGFGSNASGELVIGPGSRLELDSRVDDGAGGIESGVVVVGDEAGSIGVVRIGDPAGGEASWIDANPAGTLIVAQRPGSAGFVIVNEGSTLGFRNIRVNAGGSLEGGGTIGGPAEPDMPPADGVIVSNGGEIRPGTDLAGAGDFTPATLTVDGILEPLPGASPGRLRFRLGNDAGGQLQTDRLVVTGAVDLRGAVILEDLVTAANPSLPAPLPLLSTGGVVDASQAVTFAPALGDGRYVDVRRSGAGAAGAGEGLEIDLGLIADLIGLDSDGAAEGIGGPAGDIVGNNDLVVADLDDDDFDDIAVVLPSGPASGVLVVIRTAPPDGSGVWQPASVVQTPLGFEPTAITAGRFDDFDQLTDLAIASRNTNDIRIFGNDDGGSGAGSFGVQTDVVDVSDNGTLTISDPVSLAAGQFDIDGDDDGIDDLAIASRGSGQVLVADLAPGPGSSVEVPAAEAIESPPGNHPIIIDPLQGTGNKTDSIVVIEIGNDPRLILRAQDPDGGFIGGGIAAQTIGSDPRGVAIGDLNLDGWPDLVISDREHDEIAVVLNLSSVGGGGEVLPALAPPAVRPGILDPGSITSIDVDDDGDRDVVFAGFDPEQGERDLLVLRNNYFVAGGAPPAPGDPVTFEDPVVEAIVGTPLRVDRGDLDDDGDDDVVVLADPAGGAAPGGGDQDSGGASPAGPVSSLRIGLNRTIPPKIGCPSIGDFDGSGAVDFPDLLAILAAFGNPCSPPGCVLDLDGSGFVDFPDLLGVLAAFGPCP